jgi:uncharacterized repeat protein (TIGR03803 family)
MRAASKFWLVCTLSLPLTLSCCGGNSPVSTPPPPPTSYTFTVLHSFTGGTDGGCPVTGLTFDSAGNLYGTTGGGCELGQGGLGTVFKLAASGNETVLLNFTGEETGGQSEGFSPYGGVTLDPLGNLYGTTFNGGSYSYGTVFQLAPNGQETTLYSFGDYQVTPGDGINPRAGVARDAAGNLYGTTFQGGDCGVGFGCGILFEVQPTGQETILHQFGVVAGDGATPTAELLLVGSILYGTTSGEWRPGYGTVFSYDLTSGIETVLYTFAGGADGSSPGYGTLIQDSAGSLYGTTITGVPPSDCSAGPNCGTVFKLDSANNETVLYSFTGGSDGANPNGGLLQDSQGNLYGTAYDGGDAACSGGCGTVFKLSTAGQLTVLHSFSGSDGQQPWSALIMDAEGTLYGTTNAGGPDGLGNVYKLSPP